MILPLRALPARSPPGTDGSSHAISCQLYGGHGPNGTKSARKIDRRAAQIGTEANFDGTWGD